jgi:hypothetical protein
VITYNVCFYREIVEKGKVVLKPTYSNTMVTDEPSSINRAKMARELFSSVRPANMLMTVRRQVF